MAQTTRKLRIHGEVQGVYYRGWTVETARGLGLAGWVRNRRDGSVELLIHGDEGAVQKLIALCRDGPPAARVTHIDVEATDEEAPTGFGSRPTA
jgi:acylphosphatase